jgi:hypothetical protein
MRLEHLCRITLQDTGNSSWHRPYRRPDGTSEQEFGYGSGGGTITGDVFPAIGSPPAARFRQGTAAASQ